MLANHLLENYNSGLINCKYYCIGSHDLCYLLSKDSYQSKRRDVTAQIDAAEKLVRLQSDQVHKACCMLITWSNDDRTSLTYHGGTLGRTEDQLYECIDKLL